MCMIEVKLRDTDIKRGDGQDELQLHEMIPYVTLESKPWEVRAIASSRARDGVDDPCISWSKRVINQPPLAI